MNDQDIKEMVRSKYDSIAKQDKDMNAASCCGASPASAEVYNIMTDDYNTVEGYQPEGDLGLGCGLPTAFAKIAKGDTVIDLGSGAGNDCFVARHETGESGKVIGIDFTDSMIAKARINADKLGYNNVEFRQGDIENMPVADDVADVIVSNCVLNLVPNKAAVINEIHRVLKPGGHFSISDVVLVGELPESLLGEAELYAGCVSGAIQKDDYLAMIRDAKFENISIQKEKVIALPKDILGKYLSQDQIEAFLALNVGIFSVTVFAEKAGSKPIKPLASIQNNETCTPGGGCC